jgi:RNA-splicing ligase RtcB
LIAETDKKCFSNEAGQKYLEAYDNYAKEAEGPRKLILKKLLESAEKTYESLN